LEHQHEAASCKMQREVTRVADEAKELMKNTEQACRQLVGEEVRAQEAVLTESFLAHRRAISDRVAVAATDPRNEALAVFKEQAVCEADRLKRELEGTAAMLEERLATAANTLPTNGPTERAAEQAPNMPSTVRLFEPFQSASSTELGQRIDCLQTACAEDSLVEAGGWRAAAMTESVEANFEPIATSLAPALAQPVASWVPRRGLGRPQPAATSLPPPPLLGASLEAQARESPRGLNQGRWCVEGSSPPPRPRPLLGTSCASAPFAASKPRSSSVSAIGHGHGCVAGVSSPSAVRACSPRQLHMAHNPCDMPWRRSHGDCEIATA